MNKKAIKELLFNIDYYIDSLYLGEIEYKKLSIFILILSTFSISLYQTDSYNLLPYTFIQKLTIRTISIFVTISLLDVIIRIWQKEKMSQIKTAIYWTFASFYPLITNIPLTFYKDKYGNFIIFISNILSWIILLYGLSKIYGVSIARIIMIGLLVVIIFSIVIGILMLFITTEIFNEMFRGIYSL